MMLRPFSLIRERWFDFQLVGFHPDAGLHDDGPLPTRLLTALSFRKPPTSPPLLPLSSPLSPLTYFEEEASFCIC